MSLDAYEVVVIGSGPAGLQAAIHAARRRVSVLVLGSHRRSAAWKAHVENVLGLGRTVGSDFVERGLAQAKEFGADTLGEDAVGISLDDDGFRVTVESRREMRAGAVILATGVAWEALNAPGEKALLGRGVSHCVDCDCGFFRGKRVAVYGNGSAAVEGALTMLKYASVVHLVADKLSVSDKLREELDRSEVIAHMPDTIALISGEDKVESVALKSGDTIPLDGIFIELGAKGSLELTSELGVELDPETMKHVVVDRRQRTNVPGFFAAGDLTGKPYQIAKALGEGCVAGLEAADFVRRER